MNVGADPVVLLDLDNMLFNTRQFRTDLAELLKTAFGVPNERFWQDYAAHQIHTDDLHRYDFQGHIGSLGLDVDAVERAIESGLGSNDYLFDDVAAFLDFICTRASTVTVLTHGDHRFQYLKYNLCPGLRSVGFKDVLTHKREYIADRFAGLTGVLIDDHRVGALPAGFGHVWLGRYGEPGTYQSLTQVSSDWPEPRT